MASTMYKRLGSSKVPLEPAVKPQEADWDKADKDSKPNNHSRKSTPMIIIIILCIFIFGMHFGANTRHETASFETSDSVSSESIQEHGNVDEFSEELPNTGELEEPNGVEVLETPNLPETPETPEPEAVAEQPNEILMEQNDREEVVSAASEVTAMKDETEPPKFANYQRQARVSQVLEEWGISRKEKFHSLDEFKALIGHQCPPLRHCSKKTEVSLFQRGGKWTKEENGVYMWNSHDCWMYQFSGKEQWTREGSSDRQRLVIFVDGDKDPGMFLDASTMSELFFYVQYPYPTNYAQTQQLEKKLANIVEEQSRAPVVDLSIVVNWYVPGNAASLSRMLFHLGSSILNLNSIRVLWVTKPFMKVENAQPIIQFNEIMAGEIAFQIKNEGTSWKVRRAGAKVGSLMKPGPPGDGRPGKRVLSSADFVSQATHSVLFDVRMRSNEFKSYQDYFARNAYRLPFSDMLAGWIPNFHPQTKIVVFCGNGATALRALRLLRQQGFKNVSPLALDQITEGSIPIDLDSSIRVNEQVSVAGIDSFAPSLAAPMEFVVPGNSSLIAQYTANAVLNDVFRNEIVIAANLPPVEHICQSRSSCTSCYLSVGDIPSSRINFASINYLSKRNVPHKIVLSKEHLIWDGDWVSFLEQNKQSLLTVRKNYASAKTRKFEKQQLSSYLQNTNIVRKSDDGNFQETGESPNTDSSLPIYAGNNKLNPASMAGYNFKYPKWIQRSSFEKPAMWLGPKGSLSSLHVDHSNKGNFAYQVLGAKKWILYPPRAFDFMYGRKVGIVVWSGIIDPTEYDEKMNEEKPAFQMAIPNSIEVDVRQGEMLFNPDKWWHVVYNTESSLMLNFWIRNNVGIRPAPKT